jgi:RNA polymerase sigma factor (sigma-70 family)
MGACPNGKLSLAVRPGDEAKPAFTAEELLELGREYARVENIGGDLREDAAQEFAVAAWQALAEAEHGENLRAFQIRAGKWAVSDFLKHERLRRGNEERYGRETYPVREEDGASTEEIIVDESAEDPLQALIAGEDGARAMAFLRELPERERVIVEGIVLEGFTQRTLARKLGVSREYIGQIYRAALKKLSKKLLPL